MGNLIFGTTTIQGRTFDDIKVQTSKAGVPRPIVFGTVRPIVGNIIATTAPRIEKVTEEQSGGKGGPSVEVENEEVYRTYAIRICEGPVTAVRRVWRNNELVFVGSVEEYIEETYPDEPESVWEEIAQIVAANNAQILDKAEFFLGSYTQMPSAVMQSAFGIDNVHGYRGTCYMVVDDDNLTATGGAIPQYAFEVERCEGFVLSSHPYSVEQDDAISCTQPLPQQIFLNQIVYGAQAEDDLQMSGITPTEIDLEVQTIITTYNHPPEDNLQMSGTIPTEIDLEQVIFFIDYTYNEEELAMHQVSPTAIQLSIV